MKTKMYNFRAVLIIILINLLISSSVFGQSPNGMSYQAVIRNNSDALVTNQEVGIKISILQGSASGTAVYTETQTPTTNINGLVSIEIGSEAGFSSIDWSDGPYFIKTETDPTGGTNYTITGTSQLLSVPYALHAKTAESLTVAVAETDPVFGAWDKDYNDLTNTPIIPTVPVNVGNFNNDVGYITTFTEVDGSITNEIQDLQLVGNILTITNNGTATNIDLSAYLDNTDTQLTDAEITALGYIKNADDADADASNEIQDLQLVGNILTITNNGTATNIDLSAYLDNTDTQLTDAEITALGYIKNADDADADASNEIQDLQLVGNILTITNNGTATNIDLSAYLDNTDTQLTDAEITALGYIKNADDADADASNEIQDLQLVGNILTITNNGTATNIDLSAYLDNTDTQLTDAEIAALGYIKNADDADADASNEIQDLQLVGNILTITNNGTATNIDLSAYLDNTDTQLTDAEITALGYIKNADDADADASNEIQDLQLVGNILTITNNGTATNIDLSAYLDNTDTQLTDAEITALGYIKNADETDPTYTSSQAAHITASDITNLGNLSGTNTGDQDISGLATKTALGDSIAQVRSEIPDINEFLPLPSNPKKGDVLTWDGTSWVAEMSGVTSCISKLADAPTTYATIGNLQFRYNSISTGGYIEVRAISGSSVHSMVFCTKNTFAYSLTGSSTAKNYRTDVSFFTSWVPLISLWDGAAWNDRVTLSIYESFEATIHSMGVGGTTLPNPLKCYKIFAAIDGYNQVFIRVEYNIQ